MKTKKIELMRSTFVDFDESSLVELLKIASTSGRNYGSFDILKNKLKILSDRFRSLPGNDEMAKWLRVCTKEELYKYIVDILHFALCCFVKAPLEAPAESVGMAQKSMIHALRI